MNTNKPTENEALRTQQPAPAGATPAESVERIVHLRAYRERRIYVAGPMTGLPEYNFPLFNSTAVRLRSEGWHVENPAEHGHVEGAGWADYLRWDISRIATCGAIYLLPGWSNSKGATLEVHIAGVLALEVLLADGAEAPTPQPAPATQQAASSTVLGAIRKANMQLVRTGDDAFMLVPYKVATAQAAESVPAVDALAEAEYFIDNPSAWSNFDQRASDAIDAVCKALRAARAPAESAGRDAERLAWMADGWTPGHEKLYVQHVLETGGVGDVDDFPAAILDFARAVLAKWGTPQPTRPESGAVPLDEARRLFDAGWKAAALFCDREDVVADGIIGFGACPQFEAAFSAAHGIKGGQHGTDN